MLTTLLSIWGILSAILSIVAGIFALIDATK